MMSLFLQLLVLGVFLGSSTAQFFPPYTDCDQNLCRNGGTCIQPSIAIALIPYICICPDGFDGDRCEERDSGEDNFCSSNPCQNGGRCDDEVEQCFCAYGYRGQYCDVPVTTACSNHSCQNEGVCVSLVYDYVCICQNGFTGTYCQIPSNDVCENYNCNKGSCYQDVTEDGEVVARCRCQSGFSGLHCEVTDTCSSNPCQNGGVCVPVHTDDAADLDFYCECERGYTGELCQLVATDRLCSSNPCENGGTCFFGHCFCSQQYTGQYCETYISESCRSLPCQNGGTCQSIPSTDDNYEDDDDDDIDDDNTDNSDDDYQCFCAEGFTGDNCEQVLKACDTQPCQNGGFCHNLGPNDFLCTCASGWEGPTCAIIATSKIGQCPNPDDATVCPAGSGPCRNDLECYGLQKCCLNPCTSRLQCTEPDLSASSLCQRALAAAQSVLSNLGQYGFSPYPDMYVPQCTEDGEFEPIQCQKSNRQCWCVNQQGIEIPDTTSAPGQHPFCPDLNNNCPPVDCDKQCEFGFAVDNSGCSLCECNNPCKNFNCPSGSACVPMKVACRDDDSKTLCQGLPECIDFCFIGLRQVGDYECQSPSAKWFYNQNLMECYPRSICQTQSSVLFDSEQQCLDTCRNKMLKNITAPIGYPLILNCTAASVYDDVHFVSWKKDGKPLLGIHQPLYSPRPTSPAGQQGFPMQQPAHFTLVNQTSLRIDSVTAQDQGQYECNLFGVLPVTVRFNVIAYGMSGYLFFI